MSTTIPDHIIDGVKYKLVGRVQKNKDGSFPILDKDEVVFEPNIVYRRIRDEKPA